MKFIIKDLHDGEILEWTMEEVLEEVNRDHSNEFIPYNESDWKDGWDAWVEGGDYYTLLEVKY